MGQVSLETMQVSGGAAGAGAIALTAQLDDGRLPAVPAVHVAVPRDYPAAPPARLCPRPPPTGAFLARVEKAMAARCARSVCVTTAQWDYAGHFSLGFFKQLYPFAIIFCDFMFIRGEIADKLARNKSIPLSFLFIVGSLCKFAFAFFIVTASQCLDRQTYIDM